MGEGMSVQIAPDGRRILWLAHESAPKNFTAVDVSDPRKPKVVCQTDLPQSHMRSNSLETCGNLMAVAYQTQKKGLQPAGMELFDISNPENPKSISFFDCSGEHSRGVHQLWFCDGEYVHMASSSADFVPTHPQDDQFYRCIDVRNPCKPVELGRWHMPGTKQGDNVPPPPRHPLDKGYRAHNCNVYPQRPDRCYLAYIDGGMHVLDISDKANPKTISSLDQLAALHRLHAHRGAAVRPRADAGDRRVHGEQRQGLAEARLDSRRAQRGEPRADLDLPAARPHGLCGARPVRRPQHPRERAAADLLAVRPGRGRHLLQRRASRLRHLQPVPAGAIATFVPPPLPARRPAPPRSTTCSSTSARWCTASTVTSAGCTAWRWIFRRGRATCSITLPWRGRVGERSEPGWGDRAGVTKLDDEIPARRGAPTPRQPDRRGAAPLARASQARDERLSLSSPNADRSLCCRLCLHGFAARRRAGRLAAWR